LNDTTPARAGRREWIALAVLALPTGTRRPDRPQEAAADRAAAFGVASVVAAYSTSPAMLIAARAVLGVAGAILTPSTMSLIRTLFRDAKQMGLAIAIWGLCFSAGAVIGPVVGGAMLSQFWWGSVFLLGVPAMVLLLVVGPVLLPEYRDPNAGKLDLTSVVLSLAAVLPAIGPGPTRHVAVRPLPRHREVGDVRDDQPTRVRTDHPHGRRPAATIQDVVLHHRAAPQRETSEGGPLTTPGRPPLRVGPGRCSAGSG
jgi:MFS family permease